MSSRFFFPLIFLLAIAPSAFADITAARLWPAEDYTRLAVESSSPLRYRIFQLENPPRLVLDIESAGGDSILQKIASRDLTSADAYLKNARAARFDSGRLRAVFDLTEAKINPQAFLQEPIGGYGHRLVLDIFPADAPDPLSDLIKQLEEKYQAARPFVIAIDAGHGGEDPGAVNKNLYEKNVVLAIARELKAAIDRDPQMHGALIRDGDYFLPLATRVRRATRLRADAFVSVHADSVKSPKPRGSSVFVLSESGASSGYAQRLAANANLSDLVGGGGFSGGDAAVETALRQFSRDGKERASRRLASLIRGRLGEVNRLHRSQVESAGFVVLKSPAIPSALIEVAFMSNPDDARKLADKNFHRKVAEKIAAALSDYRRRYHLPAN